MKLLLFLTLLKITYEADVIKIIPQENIEIIVARGNIKLTDGKTIITGDSAMIFKQEEIDSGLISGSVNIAGEDIKISCMRAKYNFLKEDAQFFENVKVETQEEIISADFIFYSSKNDSSFARKNVLIEKKKEGLKIFCEEADYNFKTKKGKIRMIDRLELESDKDKIIMHGREINVLSDTLYLIGDVEIQGEKEKANSDTLVYFQKEESAHLSGNPVFYFEKGRAKGDKIILKFKNRKIERALLEENSNLMILTEKEEEVIINTSNINAFFDENGEIKKLEGFEKADGFIFLNKIKKNEGQDKD